jgi:hypothetical protein
LPNSRRTTRSGSGFYAAERLLTAKREPAAVLSFLRQEVLGERPLTLPELYMMRKLAEISSV